MTTTGDLVMLKIEPEKESGLAEFEVLFNPNSYSISKSVSWSAAGATSGKSEPKREVNAPPLQFGGGGSRQLSLELFFDVTEKPIEDVRDATEQIAKLTLINRELKSRPPWCVISWGAAKGDFPFKGVVTSLNQKFTLFDHGGTPLRATVTVTFTEYLDPKDDKKQTDPDYTTWLVKRGDTLSTVASHIYGNPTQWRVIAEANDIDDPLHLETGRRLNIPDMQV